MAEPSGTSHQISPVQVIFPDQHRDNLIFWVFISHSTSYSGTSLAQTSQSWHWLVIRESFFFIRLLLSKLAFSWSSSKIPDCVAGSCHSQPWISRHFQSPSLLSRFKRSIQQIQSYILASPPSLQLCHWPVTRNFTTWRPPILFISSRNYGHERLHQDFTQSWNHQNFLLASRSWVLFCCQKG